MQENLSANGSPSLSLPLTFKSGVNNGKNPDASAELLTIRFNSFTASCRTRAEHPEVTVVARHHAGFTRPHNVVADDIATNIKNMDMRYK